jgi:hypothetical protein
MAQIKGATSWQGLEVVLSKQHKPYQAAHTRTWLSTSLAQLSAPGQQQQQQQIEDSSRKIGNRTAGQRPRRRQLPKPLSVPPSAADESQAVLPLPAAAAAAAAANDNHGHGHQGTQGFTTPKASSVGCVPFNHLHVTEAVRKLVQLLPSRPQQLDPADRGKAAALVSLVFQLALQLAQQQQLDPRAIAHIASGDASREKLCVFDLMNCDVTPPVLLHYQGVAAAGLRLLLKWLQDIQPTTLNHQCQ